MGMTIADAMLRFGFPGERRVYDVRDGLVLFIDDGSDQYRWGALASDVIDIAETTDDYDKLCDLCPAVVFWAGRGAERIRGASRALVRKLVEAWPEYLEGKA